MAVSQVVTEPVVRTSRISAVGARPSAARYRATRDLLIRAERELTVARSQADIEVAFVQGHLAALRFAAAALSVLPPVTRQRNRSAWAQLTQRVPDLSHWAQLFESAAPIRERLEVGLPVEIDPQQVDQHLVHVDEFGHAVWDWVEAQQRAHSAQSNTPWQRAS